MIPQIRYEDLAAGKLTPKEIESIRSVGTVIVKAAVSQEVSVALACPPCAITNAHDKIGSLEMEV